MKRPSGSRVRTVVLSVVAVILAGGISSARGTMVTPGGHCGLIGSDRFPINLNWCPPIDPDPLETIRQVIDELPPP